MAERQPAAIEWVHDLGLLKPHRLSLQIYGEDSSQDLVESIRELGVLQPLYVTTEGVIISGHRRWRAAQIAGQSAPVIRKAYASKLDERRAIIELNRYRIKNGQQLYNEGKALKEIEAEKARQRRGSRTDLAPNFRENFRRSSDAVAQTIGLGSGRQWDKLQFIGEHQPQLLLKIAPSGISIHKAYGQAKQLDRQANREQLAQLENELPPEGMKIETGDFRELGRGIPSDSIDLLFTDPSYAEEYLDLWGPLAELAVRVLKPGRFLLVYCGKLYLPFVLAEVGQHLEYYWLAGKYYDQGHSFFRSRKIWDQWRPILIHRKPGPTEHEWFLDMIRMGSRQEAKEFHDHGQSIEDAKYYISRLTKRGDTVLDVCCGSGGIAVAAKLSGRRVIGFDVDETRTRITRARLTGNNDEAPEIS